MMMMLASTAGSSSSCIKGSFFCRGSLLGFQMSASRWLALALCFCGYCSSNNSYDYPLENREWHTQWMMKLTVLVNHAWSTAADHHFSQAVHWLLYVLPNVPREQHVISSLSLLKCHEKRSVFRLSGKIYTKMPLTQCFMKNRKGSLWLNFHFFLKGLFWCWALTSLHEKVKCHRLITLLAMLSHGTLSSVNGQLECSKVAF